MTTKLFHSSQLYQSKIKSHINLGYQLIPTTHAIEESQKEQYGSFNIPRQLPSKFEIVELEQEEGIDTKYVVRFPLTSDLDVAMVLRIGKKPNSYAVVTVWLNEASDNRSNCDMTRYSHYSEVNYY